MNETLLDGYANITGRFKDILLEKLSDLNEKTAARYAYIIGPFTDECGDFTMVTKEAARAYFDRLRREKQTKATLKVKLSTLRSIARYADKELGTSLLPAFSDLGVDEPEMQVHPDKMPTPANVDMALSYLREKGDIQTFTIISLVLCAGFSPSEIVNLAHNNFVTDTEGKHMVELVNDSERGFSRYIPLSENLTALVSYVGSMYGDDFTGTDPIFLNKHHKKYSLTVLENHIREVCENVRKEKGEAFKPFTLAQLRNEFIAFFRKSGGTTQQLSRQLDSTGRWFTRLDHAVNSISDVSAHYNHIDIRW